MIIFLNQHEEGVADLIGNMRADFAAKQNLKRVQFVKGKQTENYHLQGARAEMAFAKTLNKYMHPTVGELSQPDIQPNIEIRSTKMQTGTLWFRQRDNIERVFFLLIVNDDRSFRIAGWRNGRDCVELGVKHLPEVGEDVTNELHWRVPQHKLLSYEEFLRSKYND